MTFKEDEFQVKHCAEFLNFKNGIYKTEPRKVSLLAKACPSLAFYPRMFRVVFKASALAKRNEYDDFEFCKSSYAIIQILEDLGAQFEITGQEILQKLDRPSVYIGNHMSTLETFVLAAIILPYQNITFIVKDSLIRFPVFKHVMISRDPIVVGRENPRDDLRIVLEDGTKKLNDGISIIVFPQRTRTPHFKKESFNSIGIKLAKKAGVPVVPFALKTDAWGIGKPIKDFGKIDPRKKIRFAFGPPMEIKGRGNEEHQKVIDFIESKLLAWKE